QEFAVGGDAAQDIDRRLEALLGGDSDEFIEVLVVVVGLEIEAIDAVEQYADTADHLAVLIKRQTPQIGGKARRRTARAAAEGFAEAREVRARQLAELHAEQRARRRVLFAGIEMLLHDLAGGAGRESVARGRQVRAGNRLGQSAEGRRQDIDRFEAVV